MNAEHPAAQNSATGSAEADVIGGLFSLPGQLPGAGT
jgi:hypothetical protein